MLNWSCDLRKVAIFLAPDEIVPHYMERSEYFDIINEKIVFFSNHVFSVFSWDNLSICVSI